MSARGGRGRGRGGGGGGQKRGKDGVINIQSLTGLSADAIGQLKPSERQFKRTVDHSLFTKSPYPGAAGTGCDISLRQSATPQQDHIKSQASASEFYNVMVGTFPRRFMDHNATQLQHYNLASTDACHHSHAMAFFLYALETAATLDGAIVHTWIEMVVSDHGQLPVTSGQHATASYDAYKLEAARERNSYRALSSRCADVVSRGNCVGYRIWALTSSGYGPETIMRRALLRTQAIVGLCEPWACVLKLKYLIEPDERERVKRIADDMKAQADDASAEARGKKKRGGGGADDEAAEDSGGDDDASIDAAAAAPGATSKAAAAAEQIENCISKPPSSAARSSVRAQANSVGAQHVSVHDMHTYISLFLMPLARQIYERDAMDHIQQSLGLVYNKVAARWGEAVRFDRLDPPLGNVFALRELLSFRASVATLANDGVCDVQADRSSYFDDAGNFTFPLPDLVRAVSSAQLSPDEFMAELLPWYRRPFQEELAKLVAYNAAEARERGRRAEEASSALRLRHDGGQQLQQQPIGRALTKLSIKKTQTSGTGMAAGVRGSIGAEQGLLINADADDGSVIRVDEAALMSDAEDPLQAMMRKRDSCTITQYVYTDVTRLRQQFTQEWLAAVSEVSKLGASWVVEPDKPAFRAEMLNMLNLLREEEHMGELLQTLNSSSSVSEYHKQVYRSISKNTDLAGMVHPVLSIEANMTVAANAIIHRMMLISAALKLRGGYITMIDAVLVQGLQAAMPHARNVLHMLIHGPPGTGKSLVSERAIQQGITGGTRRCDHASRLADYTADVNTGFVGYYDESPTTLCNITTKQAMSDDYPRLKAGLSLGEVQYTRNERDEKTGTHNVKSVVAERINVRQALTNFFNVDGFSRGPKADMAIPDRLEVVPFVAYPCTEAGDRAINVVADRRTESAEQLYSMIAERQRVEMSLVVMVMLAVRTGVLTQINTDVIKIMSMAAWSAVERWSKWMCSSMRAAYRAHGYGEALLYTTAVSALTRAESSALVQWQRDPLDNSPHPQVMSFTLADVPRLFGPYLCSTVDHGLWSVFRHCHAQYPFVAYNIAMVIAHVFCRYRRSWMAAGYDACGVPRMDTALEECWKRCGLPTTAWPAFLQYTLDWEAELKHDVVQKHGKSAVPAFVSAFGTLGDGGGEPSSNDDPAWMERMGRGGGGGGADKTREQQVADALHRSMFYNPNWLDTGLGISELCSQLVPALRRRLAVDDKSVQATLQQLTMVRVTVPVFSNIDKSSTGDRPTPFDLEPRRVEIGRGIRNVRYDEDCKVITIRYNAALRKDTVVLSSTALMFVPQIAACLMMRAFEKNTKPRDTVLLHEMPEHPSMLCAWQVCKQESNELVLPSIGEVGTLSQRAMARAAMGADPVAARAFDFANSNPGVQHLRVDIEQEAFANHIDALYQMQPFAKTLELLKRSESADIRARCANVEESYQARFPTWKPGEEMTAPSALERKAVMDMYCQVHPARPGASEDERAALYQEMPEMAGLTQCTSYPRSHIVDTVVSRSLAVILRSTECTPLEMSTADAEKHLDRLKLRISKARYLIARLRDQEASASPERQRDIEGRCRKLERSIESFTAEMLVDQYLDGQRSADDDQACEEHRRLEMGCRALMIVLCSEPWFSRYSRPLSQEISWRPLLRSVFETVLETATPAAPVQQKDAAPVIVASWTTVPGLVAASTNEAGRRLEFEFDLNCLHWLEHARWLEATLQEMALLFATDASIETFADTQRHMASASAKQPAEVMAAARARVLECRLQCIERAGVNCDPALNVLRRYNAALAIGRRARVIFNKTEYEKWDALGRLMHSVRESDRALAIPSPADSVARQFGREEVALVRRLEASRTREDSVRAEAARLASLPLPESQTVQSQSN
jgi:hypothetical protein